MAHPNKVSPIFSNGATWPNWFCEQKCGSYRYQMGSLCRTCSVCCNDYAVEEPFSFLNSSILGEAGWWLYSCLLTGQYLYPSLNKFTFILFTLLFILRFLWWLFFPREHTELMAKRPVWRQPAAEISIIDAPARLGECCQTHVFITGCIVYCRAVFSHLML